MRFSFVWSALTVFSLLGLALAEEVIIEDDGQEALPTEPQISVTASFPENNPFGRK